MNKTRIFQVELKYKKTSEFLTWAQNTGLQSCSFDLRLAHIHLEQVDKSSKIQDHTYL